MGMNTNRKRDRIGVASHFPLLPLYHLLCRLVFDVVLVAMIFLMDGHVEIQGGRGVLDLTLPWRYNYRRSMAY